MSPDGRVALPQLEFADLRGAIESVHTCIESLEAASRIPPDASLSTSVVASKSAARLASFDALVSDLQTHLESLLRLRAGTAATRNATLPPISSLPPEIMRDIFLNVAQMHTGEGRRHSSIVLSHTCSLWRAIALDHPTLWSYISFSGLSLRLAELLVGRCGESLLKITGWYSDDKYINEDVYYLAMSELLERTGELSGVASDEFAWCFSDPRYLDSCPNLSRLSIQYDPADDFEGGAEDQVIHSRFFGGEDLPNLRHLSLYGCRFPWESGRYKALRTLKLNEVPVSPTSSSDADIGWAIRESPFLEHLEIGSTEYAEGLDTRQTPILLPPGARPISLASLHTIILRIPSTVMHWLLSTIEAPSIKVLHVDFRDRDDDPLAIKRLFTARPGVDISSILGSLCELRIHAPLYGGHIALELLGYSALAEQTLRLSWTEHGHSMNALAVFFQSIPSHCNFMRLHSVLLDSHDSERLSWARAMRGEDEELHRKLPDAPDWPAVLPHILNRLPSVTAIALHGAAHFFVSGPRGLVQVVDALSNVENLSIEGDLDYERGQRLWEWCLKLPSLRSLDMGSTKITFGGNKQHRQLFVNQLHHDGAFSIDWPRYKLFRGAVAPTHPSQI